MTGKKKILITGSRGFIGMNLKLALSRREDVDLLCFDSDDDSSCLERSLKKAQLIFHLAGVNRPRRAQDYESGNAGLTAKIVSLVEKAGLSVPIVFASSSQALNDSPYGASKKRAEEIITSYCRDAKSRGYIFRLNNVFGKWCRPNYNSVVATFCYNISRGMEIEISDPGKQLELIHIDDVVRSFCDVLDDRFQVKSGKCCYVQVGPVYRVPVGRLAQAITNFATIGKTLMMPDMSDGFSRRLYATYLSYVEQRDLSYKLKLSPDERGALAELMKSEHFGQIFVSVTKPGEVRGNHYHDGKTEKFMVLSGEAMVRLRHVVGGGTTTYRVSGSELKVIDIPPGYAHSIENLSNSEMIVLFWSNEIYQPGAPDTFRKDA